MTLSAKGTTVAEWVYWIVFLGAHIITCVALFKSARPIAAILWLIIGLMMIYVFYVVYFPPNSKPGTWPPYISSCPDYLTLIRPNQCVDFVGLNSPLLKRSDPNNPPQPGDSGAIFDSSGTTQNKTARAQQYGLSWEGIN